MSMALEFDTLQVAKQLQKSGFAEPQAEVIVSIVSDKHEELATKSDLKILRIDLENFREATKTDIKNMGQETKSGFKNLRTEFDSLRQENNADNENVRNLLKVHGESVGKDRDWFRWAMGG